VRESARGAKAARWRETIPLCLSLGAFAMSGFTFYDQYLRSEIDLWVQVPQVEIVYDYGYFTRLETVLVNKGNVPAVVFEMSAVAAITDDRPEPGCEGRAGEARWKQVSIGSSTWQRPRALSVKPGEPVAATVDIRLVGTPDDGVCLVVGYFSASGRAQQSALWVRKKLRPDDDPVAISPELRRLRHGKLEVIGGKQERPMQP
jgi:hypothetical protein